MLAKVRGHRGVDAAAMVGADEAVAGIGEPLVGHFLLPQRQGFADLLALVHRHARIAIAVRQQQRRLDAVDMMDRRDLPEI